MKRKAGLLPVRNHSLHTAGILCGRRCGHKPRLLWQGSFVIFFFSGSIGEGASWFVVSWLEDLNSAALPLATKALAIGAVQGPFVAIPADQFLAAVCTPLCKSDGLPVHCRASGSIVVRPRRAEGRQ